MSKPKKKETKDFEGRSYNEAIDDMNKWLEGVDIEVALMEEWSWGCVQRQAKAIRKILRDE